MEASSPPPSPASTNTSTSGSAPRRPAATRRQTSSRAPVLDRERSRNRFSPRTPGLRLGRILLFCCHESSKTEVVPGWGGEGPRPRQMKQIPPFKVTPPTPLLLAWCRAITSWFCPPSFDFIRPPPVLLSWALRGTGAPLWRELSRSAGRQRRKFSGPGPGGPSSVFLTGR